jgi:hypothetical protein
VEIVTVGLRKPRPAEDARQELAHRPSLHLFYFTVLISHVLLSVVTFPMILTSFYLALSNRFVTHRRLSKWTWAGWSNEACTGTAESPRDCDGEQKQSGTQRRTDREAPRRSETVFGPTGADKFVG